MPINNLQLVIEICKLSWKLGFLGSNYKLPNHKFTSSPN